MISLKELLRHIHTTSKGNPNLQALLTEAKQMYYTVVRAKPADRFGIIYSIVGPNMDPLAELCDMFDIEFQGFSMYYKVDGIECEQDIDIIDDETMAEYQRIAAEDLDILVSQAIFEEDMRRYEEQCYQDIEEEDDEDDNDIVNRLYESIIVGQDYDNPFAL